MPETLGRQMSKVRQLIADKVKALAELSVKPKYNVKVAVPCASGKEAQVDLEVFWNNIRRNFGPDPEKAKTKLSEAEKEPLLSVKWVKDEVNKMVAEAAKPPEVRALKTEKIEELTKLSAKPTVKVKVPVRCASGKEAEEDLGTFWNSIRLNFGPDQEKAKIKLSKEEKNTLLGVDWVKEEARKMEAEAAKPPEARATKAEKVKALTELSDKPKNNVKVAVRCASGEEAQEDLGVFWKNIRPNFGPDPGRASTGLSEEERNTLSRVDWVKAEVKMMQRI